MSTHNKGKTGVMLMTYGSATIAERVSEYLSRVYRGEAPAEAVRDFERRYRLIGHSPLIAITKEQARMLATRFGNNFVAAAGMRHSEPSIEQAATELRQLGASKLIGIILSPQFSSFIMEGYRTAFSNSAERHGFQKDAYFVSDPWPTEEHFIELLARRTEEALAKLKALYGELPPIVFTTHSLPERVVRQDPSYLAQLKATTEAILKQLPPELRWYSAFQSAGHTPEEWLKPDLTDILDVIKKEGAKAILIVPIQFLADHLEILYDLDRAGAEQCAERGIAYHRTLLPNTDPLFIEALASIARETEKRMRVL